MTVLSSGIAGAQTPLGFKYQAVVRDNSGLALANKLVAIRLSLLLNSPNGTSVYSEVHKIATNDFGIANLNVGSGANTTGNFATIDWGAGTYFLKTEADITNGTNFVFLGTSQLLSVPYAMFAAKSANAANDFDKDSLNELQNLGISNNKLSISKGNQINIDADTSNEIQQLSLTNNNLQLNKNGGIVDLTEYATDSQQLVLNGNTLSITKGNTIVLSGAVDLDSDPTNEIQNLSIKKDTISISKANYIILPKDNDADSTNEIQALTVSQNKLSISKSNQVNIDADTTNEIQTIKRGNDTLYLSKSNYAVLPKVNSVPSGTIITLENYDTTLINNGYSYYGRMPSTLEKKVSDSASWQWQETINNIFLPDGTIFHTAVWTGTDMIVIGQPSNPFYMKYNLNSNLWSNIAPMPSPVETYAKAVWTGMDVLLINTNIAKDSTYLYKYNPSTNLWVKINTNNSFGTRYLSSVIWTGNEIVIWGGILNNQDVNTGKKYNPITNTWLPISNLNCPSARNSHSAVWTGSEMLIWGGSYTTNDSNIYRYNPSTDIWTKTPTNNSNTGLNQHSAIWTGADMIVFGGLSNGNSVNKTIRYNLASNIWFEIPVNSLTLSSRHGHSAIWTGTEAIFWGGYDGKNLLNDGRRLKFSSPTFQGNLTNSYLHLYKKN